MVTLDRALSFIAHKDETCGTTWSGIESDLAMGLIEFVEYSKDPQFSKSIPTDEVGIIDAVRRIITRYYQESSSYYRVFSSLSEYERELMDNEIAELRAELSTLLFMMADITFKDLSAARASIVARRDAAEAIAYKNTLEEALTKEWISEDGDKTKKYKMSMSVADSYSRKVYKNDPYYIKEIEECEKIDNDYWALSRLFEQAKEVLNSMSKRIGRF